MLKFLIPLFFIHTNHAFKALSSEDWERINLARTTKSPKVLEELGGYSYRERNLDLWDFSVHSLFVPDDNLGVKNPADLENFVMVRSIDKEIYSFVATTDEFGRRYDPSLQLTPKEKFLIFHGCSFVFGTGLGDGETLSSFVNSKSESYTAYNYGVGAIGPNYMLALLQSKQLPKQIKQKNGTFIYVFIDHHVTRSNGFMTELSWLRDTPYFEREEGKLVRKGSFTSGSPIRTKVLRFLGEKLGLDRIFNINIPLKISDSHYSYTCELIKESHREFKKQFPESRFLLLYHPFSNGAMNLKLEGCLMGSGIERFTFDRPDDPSGNPAVYEIPYDGHPTAKFNDWLSERVLEYIK